MCVCGVVVCVWGGGGVCVSLSVSLSASLATSGGSTTHTTLLVFCTKEARFSKQSHAKGVRQAPTQRPQSPNRKQGMGATVLPQRGREGPAGWPCGGFEPTGRQEEPGRGESSVRGPPCLSWSCVR